MWTVRELRPNGFLTAEYHTRVEPVRAGSLVGHISRNDRARIGKLAAMIRRKNWSISLPVSDAEGMLGIGTFDDLRVLFLHNKNAPTPALDEAFLEIVDIMMKYLRVPPAPPELPKQDATA
jgi:hypothetical protein